MKAFLRLFFIAAFIVIFSSTSCSKTGDNTEAANTPPDEPSIPVASIATPSPTPSPTPAATPSPTPEPTTEPPPTPASTYTPPIIADLPENVRNPYRNTYESPYNDDGTLSNKGMGWSYAKNKDFQPPTADCKFDFRQFGGYYLGDISQKVIYLTFDEGYENGFTPQILDTLKEKNIKAAFFVTKPYIKEHPELCIRMKEEGHIVGNHTVGHKNSWELTDEEMLYEITECERYFKEATGYDMDKYFRFPAGEFSARTLSIVNDLGYKSIFWSFHYLDYDRQNQPGRDKAFETVTSYYHNGCIMLLHAVSESNTQALADILDHISANGFIFKTLDDLP